MKNAFQKLFLIGLFCCCGTAWGQTILKGQADTTKFYRVKLKDGLSFFGKILQEDSINLVMKTASTSKLEIPVSKIKRIDEIDESNFKNGIYWFPNPNPTRYFFGASAFNLKKGEGYYQNIFFFFNSFDVGITNNISMGGGFELLTPLFFSEGNSFSPIFFITPKVGFKVADKIHAAGGAIYANTLGFDPENIGGLGIAYGIVTYGTTEHQLTAGGGWTLDEGKFSKRPLFTISGMTRIARKVALVTESWIFPIKFDSDIYAFPIFFLLGIRFLGERTAVDLGFPYINFVVKF